jgi:hypothetical protein
LGTEAGAALGVGGKVGYEATVDVGKVHDSGKALVKSTGKFVDNAAPKVQNTLVLQQPRLSSKGTRLVVSTPRLNLPEARTTALTGAKKGITNTQRQARRTTSKTVGRVAYEAKDAGRAAKKVSRNVSSRAKKTGSTAKRVTKKAGSTTRKASKKVSKAAKGLFGR